MHFTRERLNLKECIISAEFEGKEENNSRLQMMRWVQAQRKPQLKTLICEGPVVCNMHFTRETEAEGIQSSARVEKHDGGFYWISYLMELFSDSCSNNSRVEGSDIQQQKRSERLRPLVWFQRIPHLFSFKSCLCSSRQQAPQWLPNHFVGLLP